MPKPHGSDDYVKQHGSDDCMDNLFGPMSPSISSRTSMSSTEGCVISKNKTRSRSEMSDTTDAVLTAEETNCLAGPLSPTPSITVNTMATSESFEDSGSSCCVPSSTTEAVTIIHDEHAVSFVSLSFVSNGISDYIEGRKNVMILVTKYTFFKPYKMIFQKTNEGASFSAQLSEKSMLQTTHGQRNTYLPETVIYL